MGATLTADVLQDDIAVSLARVMAVANQRAREAKVDVSQSLITITQYFEDGLFWRINYGPRHYMNQRGGDLIVEIDASDTSIKRVLQGQ